MKFYKYTQNNSGGTFRVNDQVTIDVLIEAPDQTRANAIAETIGIYFDGCDQDIDCSCCGDRWYRTSNNDTVERDKIEEYNKYSAGWVENGKPWRYIYFADGSKKSVIKK